MLKAIVLQGKIETLKRNFNQKWTNWHVIENSQRKILQWTEIFSDVGVWSYPSGEGYLNQWVIGKIKELELASLEKDWIFE